jgi:hypothetical protein
MEPIRKYMGTREYAMLFCMCFAYIVLFHARARIARERVSTTNNGPGLPTPGQDYQHRATTSENGPGLPSQGSSRTDMNKEI